MQSTRDAWKNSMGCGTLSIACDSNAFASWNSLGARRAASSCDACRTAISEHAVNNNGDFRT